jgi:hypothetical protein
VLQLKKKKVGGLQSAPMGEGEKDGEREKVKERARIVSSAAAWQVLTL